MPFAGRVEVLRQDNRGEGGAKNTATRAASGEFVAILDADDVYLPERLEALGELAAARPDLDILTTDATLVVDGRPVRNVYDETWTFEVADQRRAILERNFIFGHVAVRREALLAAGGFDETIRWTTDWDCWLRMIYGGSRAGLVDERLAEYRVHPDGALSSDRGRMLSGMVMTLNKARDRAAELGLEAGERRILDASLPERPPPRRRARGCPRRPASRATPPRAGSRSRSPGTAGRPPADPAQVGGGRGRAGARAAPERAPRARRVHRRLGSDSGCRAEPRSRGSAPPAIPARAERRVGDPDLGDALKLGLDRGDAGARTPPPRRPGRGARPRGVASTG